MFTGEAVSISSVLKLGDLKPLDDPHANDRARIGSEECTPEVLSGNRHSDLADVASDVVQQCKQKHQNS
jgi:hypothetical protein